MRISDWSSNVCSSDRVTATVGPGMTSRAEIEAVAEEAAERAVDKAMQRWFTTVGIAAGNPRDIQETQAAFALLRGRRRGETTVTIAIRVALVTGLVSGIFSATLAGIKHILGPAKRSD